MTSLPSHFRSCDIISCHVTATYFELQPCRSSNAPKMRPFILQALAGHFRSNVTSGHVTSFPATWRHFLSRTCDYLELQPLGAETHPKLEFLAFYKHIQVTSGQMMSLLGHFQSHEITCHILSRDSHLLQVTALWVPICAQNASFQPMTATSRGFAQMTSLRGHFLSCEVTWHHFLSCDWHFL